VVGLLHHRPENPLDFIDVCLDRVREIGWKNVRWNTFVEETEGINSYDFSCVFKVILNRDADH